MATHRIPWGRLLNEARQRFGIERFRPGQRDLIEAVLSGRDVIGLLPTGAGKSLCYELPALVLPSPVVVVSPLLALNHDQHDEREDTNVEVSEGRPSLVYVTPERLERADVLEDLRRGGVSLLVVDEAHCISQWGHDPRPADSFLRAARKELGDPPVLALTATATPAVLADIHAALGIDAAHLVTNSIERENLFFEVFRTVNEEAKMERLLAIAEEANGLGIVYVSTVKKANELHEALVARGFAAGRHHGRLTKSAREEAQARFMANEFRVMVATKAFGMGIDKSDIRFVVHWELPDSVERYYQEASRAGRDMLPARAALFYRIEDRRVQTYFLAGKHPRPEEADKVVVALLATQSRDMEAREIAEIAGVPERRAKVLLASLDAEGLVLRRNEKFRATAALRRAGSAGVLRDIRERRAHDDRARLDAIIRYAETTECRTRYLRRYFGEEEGEACGHCDNCRDHTAERLTTAAAASRPEAPTVEKKTAA